MDTVGLGHNENVTWEGAGVPDMEFETSHIILFVLMPSFFVVVFFLTHCYIRCSANMSMTFVAGRADHWNGPQGTALPLELHQQHRQVWSFCHPHLAQVCTDLAGV